MSETICAPSRYDATNKTCYNIRQLVAIADAFNKHLARQNPNHPNRIPIGCFSDKARLLAQLREKMNAYCRCNDELCWSRQSFIDQIVQTVKSDIQNNTFRPVGPDDRYEWLSTTHINNIMQQYQSVYQDFVFLGAIPLDCADHSFCILYQINFETYYLNGKRRLGIVFNTDKHGEPGAHWVALFLSMVSWEACYCDSVGKPPLDYIKKIMTDFQKYCLKRFGKNIKMYVNEKRMQEDKTECGVYCCNFLIRLLAGETFNEIVTNSLDHTAINSCRWRYFRNLEGDIVPDIRCDPKIKSR